MGFKISQLMSQEKLHAELQNLKQHINQCQVQKSEVSKGSVGWHIAHSLLVCDSIAKALAKSNPVEYRAKFSILKWVTFTFKALPQGVAKAPERVTPRTEPNSAELETQFQNTLESIKSINALPEKAFFSHPVFGAINRNKATTFLEVHTHHHIKIIANILKS